MSEIIRSPIVTILGHVDHGKTTLLDFIRKASVASKEQGGITQHIGAYQVEHGGKLITFIDTPGHAAFEKMRSRGAQVADIAVLVVAIDDGIMPQTTEAIKHIQAAKVPTIVAVNKIDLPGIDKGVQLQRIKKQLSDQNVLVEEYGGDVPVVELSAKSGEGVDKLLEMVTLVAEMHELKGDPDAEVSGVVIEANLDKFKGPIATILVRDGTLKRGTEIIVNGIRSKIRGMLNWEGKVLESADPSTPVEVLGLETVPPVGSLIGKDQLAIVAKEQIIASLVEKLRAGEDKSLKLVIKADKQGSLEAIEASLEKFNEEEKLVKIVSSGTGDIGEADIKLAASVKAIALGFNVKVAPTATKIAENEHVLIRTYNIIYELLDEMEEVIEGMIRPGEIEEVLGKAEIIAEFPYGKNERIAGCRILEGGFNRSSKVRIVREKEIIGETKLKSLRKVKEEVTHVDKGNDCGMIFDPQVDFIVGDIVESFRII
ncbi:translation initiation factor IF-2 [Candidatus Daviesbacteria bacterium RIFCSPHIGHO2_12_FULL_37_11]|uniref:Translation initiation factor IF-2 n=1 Tax=Candidatus Daviesbacteria bacterium RIFCSPHIGHO2_12_FULL_37_11 TaxID=1797777 RepID=A0A1F5KE61_9BACT|nr:MAG: translation initiation factor IF-2 [Candidatus Daviesbacteria bacterium RIFCSPHIGHO2_01_FULL_37_27]OGE39168.1 MAG: translation initiation factor IF-2 [Candidatus Daviesbacteria bacterium RIFCSPHIGHO2_12_FULL_37_11]OGE45598.1 MAG: translation initiation factor IF-2 [Candidatus Daviesbacteria bacterium RIFCSPLOWO2_01_FULL_37_10]